MTVVADGAGLRAQQAVGVLKERCLAGTVGADQRVAAALADRQRAAVEANVAVRVVEGDVLERQKRLVIPAYAGIQAVRRNGRRSGHRLSPV